MNLYKLLIGVVLLIISCSTKENVKYEHYDSGEVSKKFIYDNTEDTTTFNVEYFYKDGNLKLEARYVNGKRNGQYITYFNNSRIEESYNYKDGIKHGKFSSYNDNGILMNQNCYYNGILVISKVAQFSIQNKVFRHNYYKPINETDLHDIGYLDYDMKGNVLKNTSVFYNVLSVDTINSMMLVEFYNKKEDYSFSFQEIFMNNSGELEKLEEVYETLENKLSIKYNADNVIIGTVYLKGENEVFDFPFYFDLAKDANKNVIGIESMDLDSVKVE